MTIEEIRELLRVFNESGVAELELQQGKDRLRIRKAVSEDSTVHAAPLPSIIAAPAIPTAGGLLPPQAPVAASPELAEPESGQVLVKSPIVGTFYESPSPGSPAFVKVGDAVEPGQVLCIIESMKLMNEIEAEVGGVVAARLVENGRPVEYGEALFAIQTR